MNKLKFISSSFYRKGIFAKKSVRLFFNIIGSLLALIFVILLLLLGRLSMGPINLDFLTPDVEAALNSPQVGLKAKIEHTQLVWESWKRPFEIELVNVHLEKEQDPHWLKIEQIGVSIRLLKLFEGQVALKQLRFYRPHIVLERNENGEFLFGLAERTPNQENTLQEIIPLLTLGEASSSLSKLNDLSMITIIEAHVSIKDKKINQTWELPKTTFTLKRQKDSFNVELILQPQEEKGALNLKVAYSLKDSRLDAYVDFHQLSFSTLFSNRTFPLCSSPSEEVGFDNILNFLQCWNLPLHGEMHLALVPATFQLIEGHCDVNLGKGALDLSLAKLLPLPVHSGNFSLSLSPHEIHVEKIALLADEMFLELSGGLHSSFDPFLLTKLFMPGQTLNLEGKIKNLLLNHLSALWPQDFAANAREWLTKNLRTGTVTEATINFKGHGEEKGFVLEELGGTLQGEGVEVTYLEGLPPAQDVAAHATFNQHGFNINILSGEVNNIKLEEGHVLISGLDSDQEALRLNIKAQGALSHILDTLNHKPLEYASYGGIDPKKAKGEGKITLKIDFPLLTDLQFKDVKIGAQGAFQKVALERKITEKQHAQLKEGTLFLDLTQDKMLIKGKGTLNQLPSTFNYIHYFTNPKPYELEIQVGTTASFEDFKRLGFDYADYAQGPTQTKLTYRLESKNKSRLLLNLDLKPVTLLFPPLEWIKKSGEPGALSFSLIFKDGSLTKMKEIKLSSAPYSCQGEVEFAEDKSWKTIHLTEFKGPNTQVQVALNNPRKNFYEASFKGTSLDIEKFLNYINSEKNTKDHLPTDIKLTADVDKLRLGEQKIFENVKVSAELFLQGKDTTWKAVHLRAKAGEGTVSKGDMAHVSGGILFDIKPGPNNTQTLEVRANDAGAFLKNLTLYEDIRGGYITVKASRTAQGPYKGAFKLKRFEALEVPLLARFAALLSPMGIANLFSEKKALFMDTFECNFDLTEDLILVKTGVGKSMSLGFTVEGALDRKKRLFSLKGNIIPARFLNSILGNIPLIGSLLNGGEGEGLFAIAYTVTGSFGAPNVSLNPLSAFAPGFLRKLFQSLGDGE